VSGARGRNRTDTKLSPLVSPKTARYEVLKQAGAWQVKRGGQEGVSLASNVVPFSFLVSPIKFKSENKQNAFRLI